MSRLQEPDNPKRRYFLRTATLAGLSLSVGVHAGTDVSAGKGTNAKSPYLGSSIDFAGIGNPTQMQGALRALPVRADRTLHLVNAHTGDDFNIVYFKNGRYLSEGIARFNHLMRDRRANIATNMDTTLYDQLFLLREDLGTGDPIHVLSGYRTPETNAKLRRRSKGVAKYSLHMEGRAADIYVPGCSVNTLHSCALKLSAGGVGMYSSSHFIHIDTGPVRSWGG